MIKSNKQPIPMSMRPILNWLKTRGINFFTMPKFDKGIVIGNTELTEKDLNRILDFINKQDTLLDNADKKDYTKKK